MKKEKVATDRGFAEAEDASNTLVGAPRDGKQANATPELDRKHAEFLSWKFGLFMHFNIATWHDVAWATGHEDPLSFAPDKLDCRQWADAALAAGMRYAVLTAKHTEGYPLWRSDTTTHDIAAFKNFRGGNGDLIKEYVEAFREKGLKVGLYYCLPGNYSRNGLPPGATDIHGMPPEANADREGMARMVDAHIEELLTRYGTIDLMWFDQIHNSYTGVLWLTQKALVHRLQPDCVVVGNNATDYRLTDVYSYEYPWLIKRAGHVPGDELPPEGNQNAAEVCDTAMKGWFWHSSNQLCMNAAEAYQMLKLCNSRKANYLLNIPPDRSGLITSPCLEFLHEIGRLATRG